MFELTSRNLNFCPKTIFDEFFKNMRSVDFIPPLDVIESDVNYLINVEIPDLDMETINVEVESDYVSINGTKKLERNESGSSFAISERVEGIFSRVVKFPKEVDGSKTEANYKNGILTVVVPKKESTKKSKIEIKVLQ